MITKESTVSIFGLIAYIKANGPVSLTDAIAQSGYVGEFVKARQALHGHARAYGQIETVNTKWQAVKAQGPGQYIPEFKPLSGYNLTANVRPGGMDFRAIPTRWV